MQSLGQKLREARESKGWTIEETATRLKINPRYFEAIENDDSSSLPGGFFYRSFVRQYATLVGLPESSYTSELQRLVESDQQALEARATSLPEMQYDVPPMPTGAVDQGEETKKVLWRVLALVLVIVFSSGIYMLWERWRSLGDQQMAQQAQLARQESEKAAASQSPLASPPQDALPAPAADPNQKAALEAIQPPVSTPTEPEPAKPAIPAPPQQDAAANTPPATASGAVRLTLTAKENVWVDVWDGDRRVFSNVIAPGESRQFSGSSKLRVRYGNAGGIDVQWNGKPTETPGPRGQIRTWEYLPDTVRFVAPPPKPADPAKQTPPA